MNEKRNLAPKRRRASGAHPAPKRGGALAIAALAVGLAVGFGLGFLAGKRSGGSSAGESFGDRFAKAMKQVEAEQAAKDAWRHEFAGAQTQEALQEAIVGGYVAIYESNNGAPFAPAQREAATKKARKSAAIFAPIAWSALKDFRGQVKKHGGDPKGCQDLLARALIKPGKEGVSFYSPKDAEGRSYAASQLRHSMWEVLRKANKAGMLDSFPDLPSKWPGHPKD